MVDEVQGSETMGDFGRGGDGGRHGTRTVDDRHKVNTSAF
jgi:hypothetical protein